MGHIKNLPDYANNYTYVVARKVGGEWWFWGAYNTLEQASRAAWEINGEVFTEWIAA